MRPSNLDLSRLDEMINYCLESNLNKLEDELIREIHPQINVQYNSLNIAVGRQRSGKTYSIIREIIKISNVCPRTHLFVYINKEGAASDPTFESLKSLIRIPIKYVPENKGVLQMYAVCTHFLAVIPTIQKFLNELKIQPKKKYFQPV